MTDILRVLGFDIPVTALTLAEFQSLSTEFGIKRVSELDLDIVEHMVAYVTVMARRADPGITVGDVLEGAGFEWESSDDQDPTPAGTVE